MTKKYLMIFTAASIISCTSLNCMQRDDSQQENAAAPKSEWKKSDYYEAKNNREDLINSDKTHIKRAFINNVVQLAGVWTNRAVSMGADSLRKKYFGLTEEEAAQRALAEEMVETKKAETSLLDSRDINERIDAIVKLCRSGVLKKQEDCDNRLQALLDELDQKTKNKK